MQRTRVRSIINLLARTSLGLTLLAAAVAKLFDLNRFAARIGDFGLVFDQLVEPTAWFVVLAESLIGIAVLTYRRGGVAAATLLLLLFTSVLWYGIVIGLDLDCGCFGPAVHVSLETQLLLDCGLLALCLIIQRSNRPGRSLTIAGNGPSESSQVDQLP